MHETSHAMHRNIHLLNCMTEMNHLSITFSFTEVGVVKVCLPSRNRYVIIS